MNPTSERIGERLRIARELLGLDIGDVAKRIGLNSYQLLSNMEKGTRSVKASELAKLATIYHRDLYYFLLDEESSSPEFSFAWRDKNPDMNSTIIENEIRQVIEYYILLEKLNDEPAESNVVPWDIPQAGITIELVNRLAENLVEELQFGFRPAVNLTKIMENKLRVKTIYYDLSDYGSGIAVNYNNNLAMVIDADEAPWRRNFNLAHELFHLYARNIFPLTKLQQYETDKSSLVEDYANEFAAALLLPSKYIIDAFNELTFLKPIVQLIDVIKLSMEFGVSAECFLWRLVNLGKLREAPVKKMLASEDFKFVNKRAHYGMNKPEQHYSDRFLWLGIKALKDSKISKRKFCQIFNIRSGEYSSFLAKKGLEEALDYGEEIETNS
jgi:Zn-dependent peptidase ImmA (M78 family)/transcriptional regulator with XRE-family HTH domain